MGFPLLLLPIVTPEQLHSMMDLGQYATIDGLQCALSLFAVSHSLLKREQPLFICKSLSLHLSLSLSLSPPVSRSYLSTYGLRFLPTISPTSCPASSHTTVWYGNTPMRLWFLHSITLSPQVTRNRWGPGRKVSSPHPPLSACIGVFSFPGPGVTPPLVSLAGDLAQPGQPGVMPNYPTQGW